MLFRKTSLIGLSAFGLLAGAWVFQFCILRDADRKLYQSFLDQKEAAGSSDSVAASSYQTRQGVRKDIWFAQEDNSRLQYRIESESSVLTLLPNKKKMDVIENLQKMRCWMQDKLYLTSQTPMQQMRYFDADKGTYQFTTQKFEAQSVNLSLYRLPGHGLPQTYDVSSAFLRGIAQDVTFSISGKTPQFQAQQFKAILKSDGQATK
jgi:hypothetical protein